MFLHVNIVPSVSLAPAENFRGGGYTPLLSAEKNLNDSPAAPKGKTVYSSSNAFFVPIAIGIAKRASFFIQMFRELLFVFPEHMQSFAERLQTFPKPSGILPENTRTYPELLRSFPENTRIFPENTQSFPENVRISPENTCLPAGTVRHSDENACQTDSFLYIITNKSIV